MTKKLRTLPRWQHTLWVMTLAQFLVAFGFSVIFPFLPLYVADLGSSSNLSIELLAGLAFSAQAFTMMFSSPIWGTVADRYGRKLMVERAMFGGTFIVLLMAFARSAEELILLRGMQGLITGTVTAANALVAAVTPREHSGYALGTVQTGFWTGIATGPLIGGLIADSFGYRLPFIITAAMLLLGGVIVWFGVQEDFTPASHPKNRPALFTSWQQIITTRAVSFIFGMRFLTFLAHTSIIPILPLFVGLLMTDTAWVNTLTGAVVGIKSLTTTISAIYLGRLGDRIGHRQVLMACAFVAAVTYLPQGFVSSAWQLLILAAISGVAFGGIIPVLGALLAQYTQPGDEGIVYGLDGSIGSAARTIAPLVGSGVAIWLGLQLTFVVSGLMFFLIVLLAWRGLARKPRSVEVGI